MDLPRHIDLPFVDSRAPSSAGSRKSAPSPGPRIQHYDGDIPPALSPLDAFAAHSRKLAKELEETRLAGQRRMSRLPPQIVTQSLTQHQANRPAIFRSLSSNGQDLVPPLPQFDHDIIRNSPDIVAPTYRPTSSYPRISAVLGLRDDGRSQNASPIDFPQRITSNRPLDPSDYFGGVRAESPEPIDKDPYSTGHSRTGRTGLSEPIDDFPALAPPNAAFARNRPYHESSDDDYTSSNAGSFFSSRTRKLSSSSNVSAPLANSMVHNRSSSNNSSASLPGHQKTPSHLNFSRPRSSASSHTKLDSPTRSQVKLIRKDSQFSDSPRGQTSFDDARSATSDGVLVRGPSSQNHTRYNLPRGRAVDRTSSIFTTPPTPYQEWANSITSTSPPLSSQDVQEVSSPPLESSGHESDKVRSGFSFDFEGEVPSVSDQLRWPSSPRNQLGPVSSNSSSTTRPTASLGAQKVPSLPPIPGSTYSYNTDGKSLSSYSDSTVRPSTSRSVSNYTSLTPEDHVTKGIDLHQHGDLKESTYHLRIAAKHNHSTGMLLYALACRHGWGMRPSPREGVIWLKKAVDSAMLEVAEDENEANDKPKSDFHQKKEHKAQFALSIYELGVSHLNGWGVEQDKALALRCFEIAGGWGDPDALSEAGFCYSEGIGCKKDLKKAAKFYRMAADKGISMVGNSWIYKDKYNDSKNTSVHMNDDRGRGSDSPKKGATSAGRSKSKTRGIFARKKSAMATV